MIYLSAYINWPFKFDPKYSKDYFYKSWRVTKNKTLEIQISRMGNSLIGGSLRYSIRESHAGLVFDIGLLRRFISVSFVDNRHWNDEADRYVNYDNLEEVEKYY